MSQVVIRARDKLVTLLDGIIFEKSSKTVPDPQPILLTAPASSEFTTLRLIFLSRPVRRVYLHSSINMIPSAERRLMKVIALNALRLQPDAFGVVGLFKSA